MCLWSSVKSCLLYVNGAGTLLPGKVRISPQHVVAQCHIGGLWFRSRLKQSTVGSLRLCEHWWGEVNSHSPKFPSAAASESPDYYYNTAHLPLQR